MHLFLVVEGLITLVTDSTEEGEASFLEESLYFLRQSEATKSIFPEGQTDVRVDGLGTMHEVDVGVVFFDLIILRRTDVEVTTIDFFFEGRATRGEAVIVFLRDGFITLGAPGFFLLTDIFLLLALVDLEITVTHQLSLMRHRQRLEGRVGLILLRSIGRRDHSTTRLEGYFDLQLLDIITIGHGLTILTYGLVAEAIFLKEVIEVCIVLDEIYIVADRYGRGEARSAFVTEFVLYEGHDLTLRSEAIERRIEEPVRELDQFVTTVLFVADDFRKRSGELQVGKYVVHDPFLSDFDFLDDGTYGEVNLDATLDLLLAFLSGEDDSRRSDLVDRQPVDSRSKLSCDVATVAGDSELLRFPSGREDERSSICIEDDVSSALLDIYDALHAASVDYYGSSTIHAAIIGRSLDLEGIPLLLYGEPRAFGGEG